jgi:hypothetical protein
VKGWVIAHSVEMVAAGERAFVQQLGETEPDRLTYSSLMSAQECAAIDLSAYRDARSWYVSGGSDTTVFEGVSLGRAFEYCATESLIRHRRAALVLDKLLEDSADKTVRLRGVGDEWSTMARVLGANRGRPRLSPVADHRHLPAAAAIAVAPHLCPLGEHPATQGALACPRGIAGLDAPAPQPSPARRIGSARRPQPPGAVLCDQPAGEKQEHLAGRPRTGRPSADSVRFGGHVT